MVYPLMFCKVYFKQRWTIFQGTRWKIGGSWSGKNKGRKKDNTEVCGKKDDPCVRWTIVSHCTVTVGSCQVLLLLLFFFLLSFLSGPFLHRAKRTFIQRRYFLSSSHLRGYRKYTSYKLMKCLGCGRCNLTTRRLPPRFIHLTLYDWILFFFFSLS